MGRCKCLEYLSARSCTRGAWPEKGGRRARGTEGEREGEREEGERDGGRERGREGGG
jgi:hypothetical protein